MSTYKRPLLEGEVCEDLRSQYNSNIGKGNAVEEVAPVKEVVTPKPTKKEKEVVAEPTVVAEPETADEKPLDMVVG